MTTRLFVQHESHSLGGDFLSLKTVFIVIILMLKCGRRLGCSGLMMLLLLVYSLSTLWAPFSWGETTPDSTQAAWCFKNHDWIMSSFLWLILNPSNLNYFKTSCFCHQCTALWGQCCRSCCCCCLTRLPRVSRLLEAVVLSLRSLAEDRRPGSSPRGWGCTKLRRGSWR